MSLAAQPIRRPDDAAQTDQPLRAAVVGVGVMGWNHSRALAGLPGVDLVGVVDPDHARRTHCSNAFACAPFETVDAAIAEGLDFAVVAVPNTLHREIGVRLLQAGVHVLMEKPIASNVDDAEALINAAAAHGRKLMVGHIERFNPAARAVAKACEDDQIISIDIARVGPFPARMAGVGVVIDLGVHDIDLIRMITRSEIAEANAQISAVRGGHEDSALLQFRTESGVAAHLNTNWITPYKARRIQVATQSKYIAADLISRQVVEYFDYRPDGSYATRHLSVQPADALQDELSAFADSIRNDTPAPISGEDGLRNLRVALDCLASVRDRG
ncbi:MAG: Gfo/Idh/MocA family oxidoreductase [Pseudomonadota bacterium]